MRMVGARVEVVVNRVQALGNGQFRRIDAAPYSAVLLAAPELGREVVMYRRNQRRTTTSAVRALVLSANGRTLWFETEHSTYFLTFQDPSVDPPEMLDSHDTEENPACHGAMTTKNLRRWKNVKHGRSAQG